MDYIKNQDKKACMFCKSQKDKPIIAIHEALTVPFSECTNERGCRCYVALDVEEKEGMMDKFWKFYEATLKFFRYNQGMRGNFFYSEKHEAHYTNKTWIGPRKFKKDLCKLDNGKIVEYTEMRGDFRDIALATKFDDYVLLGRGKWHKF